jgi:phosphoribosyl-ATP pyrophosphohydrolase/phosphoribosyl-AMP cyclohydrolase
MLEKINFDKLGGLIPACIQDYATMQILMIGFMNKEALERTLVTKQVTFFSRSKNRLWTKGETSGNYLAVISYCLDCDNDALLIYAKASGPTCHTGDVSCFNTALEPPLYSLAKMIATIEDRYHYPQNNSYTNKLFTAGTKRIAQKVGEEGVEVALAAVSDDNEELANETADLLFHLFVLLKNKKLDFSTITNILQKRMKNTGKK